jgi:hypothetical protein
MSDVLDGIDTLQGLVLLALALGAFGLEGYAFISVLRQKSAAFPAAGKLTKTIWSAILGVATAIGFVSLGYFMDLLFLNMIGVVAAGVYLADVRPAVARFSGRGGSSGPYGSW